MTRKLVTWLGEDPSETVPGPSFNLWGDPLTKVHVRFDKGQPVTISDEDDASPPLLELSKVILAKAPINRFYAVEDVPAEPGPLEESGGGKSEHPSRRKKKSEGDDE